MKKSAEIQIWIPAPFAYYKKMIKYINSRVLPFTLLTENIENHILITVLYNTVTD